MSRFAQPHTPILIGAAAAILGVAALAVSQMPMTPEQTSDAATPAELLAKRIDDATPHAPQLARGRYRAPAGDCMSCHLREGGEPFAGGLGLKTPFGVIYSTNITSDARTGIGAWTSDQFYQAMHDGKGVHGEHLYPAFPY